MRTSTQKFSSRLRAPNRLCQSLSRFRVIRQAYCGSGVLIIRFSAVPEPAAIGLFGAAVVPGMNRRRRRDKEPV